MSEKDLFSGLPAELPSVLPMGQADTLHGAETGSAMSDKAGDKAAWEAVLRSPQLADWARDLLNRLAARFSNDSPYLFLQSFRSYRNATPVIPRAIRREAPEAKWLIQFLTNPNIDATIQREWLAQCFLADDPVWLYQLLDRERAKVARIFLLTGNIADYAFDSVFGYRPGVRLLIDALKRHKDGVVTISLSQGVNTHTQPESEQLFEERFPEGMKERRKQGGLDLSGSLIAQLGELFAELRQWLKKETELTRGVAVVFENIHLMIPPDRSDLERNYLIDGLLSWSVDPQLFRSPHCLILIAEALEDVTNELRARGGKIEPISIVRPVDAKARLKFLLPLLQPEARMLETRVSQERSGLELRGYDGIFVEKLHLLAHDTAGLTYMGIEDILQQVARQPGATLDRDGVMAAKRERLQQESAGLLEVITPRRTLDDLAGYDALKQRLREVITALKNSADPLVRSTIPMGILFLGPPGTGKTIAAEAIAGESGISMAKLGDFRDMYVGQSERNLSRLLSLIESLHPVIVFIDELDQAEGTRGEGGSHEVSKRIFGKLLQFMSDTSHRGKILWIGASNRPDLVDAAMKRPGRFDLVLPFLLPDLQSRALIIDRLLHAKLRSIKEVELSITREDCDALAERTEGLSGAEIEALLTEVIRRAAQQVAHGRKPVRIDRAAIEAVLAVYAPPQVREHYHKMEELTLAEVRFSDLLPPEYKERHRAMSARSAQSETRTGDVELLLELLRSAQSKTRTGGDSCHDE
jgi:SpoVK/Ycf46/Vps4 family AAA+-type ATPase